MRQDITRAQDVRGLIGWILLSVLAGAVGALASVRAAQMYNNLWLPPWAPPAKVFGPVWSVLYLVMAVAAWLVWRERGWGGARRALTLYVVQLVVFNALWSWLFFKWHLGLVALIDIVVLTALVVATIAAFAKIRPVAAVLLLPYLLWLIFASALNTSAWLWNPWIL